MDQAARRRLRLMGRHLASPALARSYRRAQPARAEADAEAAAAGGQHSWEPVEGANVDEVLERHADPVAELLAGVVPAFIVRGAYSAAAAAALVRRFYERGLLYEPPPADVGGKRARVDIGTSMGGRGRNREAYFEHSAQTLALFSEIFAGLPSPLACLHGAVAGLCRKPVVGAYEEEPAPGSGGGTRRRAFGPGIFRCYHDGAGQGPHLDSLARDRATAVPGQPHGRVDYAIGRFARQLSCVLCLQPSAPAGRSGEAVIYRDHPAPTDSTRHVRDTPVRALAAGTPGAAVALAAGDLYVFCSEFVHEVPYVEGPTPRVVLASFLCTSLDEPEVFAWS
jgi:hypothetical protein